ncbi:MAG TPA: hypothetical protein VKG79_04610 [Bryobacteraceae bacterium]|nr:hypothetical protein [Bryobacteraceae bacterium]
MKKLAVFAAAVCLFAADPWQSKPYTQWSEKDVQKILSSSPWARPVAISGVAPPVDAGATGRGESANRPPGMDPTTGPGAMQPNGQEGGRDRMGDVYSPGAATNSSFVLTVLWESAMPVKQALARRKLGAEAATSPDAKKFLDANDNYLITVSGLTPELVRPPLAKSEILKRTALSAKGKDALHATDIVINPSGKVKEAIFVFPKTTRFTLEDKDVEFSTQLGSVEVKSKFHLKDMVVNGALEL